MPEVTEVVKIRRKVLAEIARLTFAGRLKEEIHSILTTVVTDDGPRYRCCVHKERAVLRERINLALSQPLENSLTEAAEKALAGEIAELSVVNVLPEACDRCPIDKFIVTDACRNCLAHHCIASCPKKAVMVVQNRAYIDKTKCVECGMCKKSCPYGAIIEISRPCERACAIGAIKAGNDRRAVIDFDSCTECGACKMACPFGAIGDSSVLVQVIRQLQDSDKRVYAVLAPAFISQFGLKVRPGQVIHALKQIGFTDVKEVSVGADIVTIEETKEFVDSVPEKRPFMTTSCCPAFVNLVEKHLPEMLDKVSSTVSPMVAIGRFIKQEDPEAVVVFLGPCIAKKSEAEKYKDVIDFVMTFEELAALMVGAGINIAEAPEEQGFSSASHDGNAFAYGGGVTQAVLHAAKEMGDAAEIKPHRCEGLANCLSALKEISGGKLDANFFEGMACAGGCVGGPGNLTDFRVAAKFVETYAAQSPMKTAPENPTAKNATETLHHWHK